MNEALQVQGLRKAFGGVQAVADVSFAVAPAEMLALIGRASCRERVCHNV